MGNRRLAREAALQTIYLFDTGKMELDALAPYIEEADEKLGRENLLFFQDILEGVIKNVAQIDPIISKYAKNWTIDRMSVVDRSILRLATYELVFSKEETPVAAVIDEAIELSKKFSTENSSRFINGMLDQVKNERNISKD
ncbi:N utilization substance protein B [Parelusimicrobium proximum]|uniref:transcription antitermination factor NusB n=1 Tax=Parelusimicrobium proximum TaxID=3228953 RepID=UPI003D167CF6